MRFIIVLLAFMLALSAASSGEGTEVPVDAFIARTGIDEMLREKVECFLRDRGVTARTLDLIDDARLARYAEHLANDLPIAYDGLLDEPSRPMPEGAAIRQLAVLLPQGAAMESLLVDFERKLIYYDETYPVPRDVCRAECAGTLSDGDGSKLMAILNIMPLEDRTGDIAGTDFGAIRLAVHWDGGVTRCAAGGAGVSGDFIDGVRALLDAGRTAAQGEDSCD